MVGLAAAILLLMATGFPGVALLRRIARAGYDLSPLEQLSYGMPLGVTTWALASLPLAIWFGFSATLLTAIGFVAICCGIFLLHGTGPLKIDLTWPRDAEQKPVSLARVLRERIGLLALIVLGGFVVRWAILWSHALVRERDGLWAYQVNIWGDWALHLGDVTSFAYGDNFPPINSRYAGAPLAYHYLTSITAASFVKLGMDPVGALTLQSFLFCLLLLGCLYAFARHLTRDSTVAAGSVALFLLGGSLGWWLIVQKSREHGLITTLLKDAWNPWQQNDAGFQWQNMFFALIEPQRGYLYGLPLFLLIVTLLMLASSTEDWRIFAVAGLIAGLLPFAHTSTLVALALIAPFVALFLVRPSLRSIGNWALFFVLWVVTSVPQLYLQQGGQRGETKAIRIQWGWIVNAEFVRWNPANGAGSGIVPLVENLGIWVLWWLRNLSFFVPFLLLALWRWRLLPRQARLLLWGFMPCFVICNVIVFRPWDWDNTKFFFYWFIAVCIFVSAWMADAWRRHRSLLVRGALVIAVIAMTLSGLLVNFQQLTGQDRNLELSAEELEVATQVRERTPTHSLFAVGTQHNHPVPVMAGRRVLMSYEGWLYAFGIDYQQRLADLRIIFALGPTAPQLINRYAIDYVVIGPNERTQLGANLEGYRSRYPRVIATTNYEIFKVR